MQHPFFEALRNGKTESAALLLIDQLKKDDAQPGLINETKLLLEEFKEKTQEPESPEALQRIQEHYASKILDIWEKYESSPGEASSHQPSPQVKILLKIALFLIVFATVLILVEWFTW